MEFDKSRSDGWWLLIGERVVLKTAADVATSFSMKGKLYLSNSGWILLEVPNALLRGAFDALHEPGIELPIKEGGGLNAHISVIRPEELRQIPGGSKTITERGHAFGYTLGPVHTVSPNNWKGVSKVWMINVKSPELEQLRKSYGLPALPKGSQEFHITIGLRRTNVLRNNDVAKFVVDRARTVATNETEKSALSAGQSASVLDHDWTDVPRLVGDLVRRGQLAQQKAAALADPDVWWDPHTDDLKTTAAEGCLHVKTAAALGYLGSGWSAMNKAFGGPSALSTTLAGGLLLGGGGYLAGHAFSRYLPADRFDKKVLPTRLGLMGAAAGVLPGLWAASAASRNAQRAGQPLSTWQSFSTPFAQLPVPKPAPTGVPKAASEIDQKIAWWKEAIAGYGAGGGLGTPSIPVDAFNRVVWNDVRPQSALHNPLGTKSQWGDNSQGLHTPPAVAAATTGLLSGVAAQHGSSLLSPRNVIHGLVGAGVGWAAATLAGQTLGALAGLKPQTQKQLQTMGVWGGVLNAVIPPLFGQD